MDDLELGRRGVIGREGGRERDADLGALPLILDCESNKAVEILRMK